MKSNKRGAVELSMTTIVVVVIGITILTLGLRWIYSIFTSLGEQSEQLDKLTQDQIRTIFTRTDDAISSLQSSFSVEQGKKYNLEVYIRNIKQEPHKFKYRFETDQESIPSPITPDALIRKIIWFKRETELKSGEGVRNIAVFDTKGLPLGTYLMQIILECIDCGAPETASVQMVMEVSPK